MNSPLHSVLINGVVFKDRTVLVAQRSWEEKHAPGCWTIPGGKVEETPGDVFNVVEETLQSEIAKETGVTIDPQSAVIITNYPLIRNEGTLVITLVIMCNNVSADARIPMDRETF